MQEAFSKAAKWSTATGANSLQGTVEATENSQAVELPQSAPECPSSSAEPDSTTTA